MQLTVDLFFWILFQIILQELILELELEKPEERTPLLIETVGNTKIHDKKYPISLITDPLEIEAGNVKWTKTKKLLKRGLKFAAPTLSKRIKTIFDSD